MPNKMNEAQKFIHISKYSRWIEAENRRETSWEETCSRYLDFMRKRFEDKVPKKVWKLLDERVKALGVVPSMRAVAMAGPALDENNIMGYNCSFVPFLDLQAPVELFYILMCGTGVGLSVESHFIKQMPEVAKWNGDGVGVYVVEDSREGWANSLKTGFENWFAGKDIEFDYSRIRARGTRLKRTGGRASGPEPLKRLHDFCRHTVSNAQGRKLTSLEWLDIANMIGDVVVVGGVRRASEISFSDLDDDLIRNAKTGAFPTYRYNSNNSAVYFSKPDAATFLREWLTLVESGTGERGIFNVHAIKNMLPKRREFRWDMRSNPCGEILLRPFSFCNLSEVIVRAEDEFDDVVEKVECTVWLGAMQSTMTQFPYLRPDFKKNCEEERLLGVSLTGQMDNPSLMTPEKLAILKKYAIKTAKKASAAFGINLSAAITTGKPSGTVSQLADCASGAHPRYAQYYIRRYRLNSSDPVYRLMKDQGVKFFPENGQGPDAVEKKRQEWVAKGRTPEEARMLVPDWDESQVMTWVCEFPTKAPAGAIVRSQVSAIDQLEWYLKMMKNWVEHNQSISVYVRHDEWLKVGAWVYDHFDEVVGVSFIPYEDANIKYKLAPYEEISKEEYEARVKAFPKLDYSNLAKYELEDATTAVQQLACTSGACELA